MNLNYRVRDDRDRYSMRGGGCCGGLPGSLPRGPVMWGGAEVNEDGSVKFKKIEVIGIVTGVALLSLVIIVLALANRRGKQFRKQWKGPDERLASGFMANTRLGLRGGPRG